MNCQAEVLMKGSIVIGFGFRRKIDIAATNWYAAYRPIKKFKDCKYMRPLLDYG